MRWRVLQCGLCLLAVACLRAEGIVPQRPGDVSGLNATRALGSGNPFWDRLYEDCGKRTSLKCVQKSVFRYLKKSLGERDVFVTDSLVLRRNHNGFSEHPATAVHDMFASAALADKKKDVVDDEDNELMSGFSLPTIEDITDDLYDQGMSFIKSHDVHLRMPSLLGGAEVVLSPRTFEEDGATFKISFSRPHVDPSFEETETARLKATGIIKRITQKLFKKRLMTSFFALLLIVKMIKVKLLFLLPLILGVGTAKKLLLKVLLFLFPALSHLFKLCTYYHANYAKYHHHHHKIAHHHHVIPVPVPQPVPQPVPVPVHHPPEPSYSGSPPPYSGPSSYHPDPSGPVYGSPEPGTSGPGGPDSGPGPGPGYDWPSAPSGPGPGAGYDAYANNRNENIGVLPAAHQQNNDVLASWGLGDDQRVYRQTHTQLATGKRKSAAHTQSLATVPAPAPASRTPVSPSQPGITPLSKVQVVGPTVEVAYDAFYSPLLQRMDNVFVQLGFNEEACRERLVCSMYKSPARFAPHSNLLSAELSRDPNELQKPSSLNSAVVRYFRYVQAARDGQSHKDCLLLYPTCTVNTEL